MMDSMQYRVRQVYADELLGDWTIGDKLGGNTQSGSESLVVALKRKDGTEVSALKVAQIYKNDIQNKPYQREEDEKAKSKCLIEVESMKKLKGSPYIMDCEWAEMKEWEGDGYYGCDLLIRMPYKECLRLNPYEPLAVSCETAVQIGKDICQALIQCHAESIIHRDIKPGNIFVETRDGVKRYLLGDFGIAKISSGNSTASSSGRCTLQYAAPEQYRNLGYTKQVDIYCLGLTLYELCNEGRLPFMNDSSSDAETMARRRAHGEPFPGPRMARKNLSDVIMKACAYNAEDRYQSAEEFLDALNALNAEDLQPRPAGEQPTVFNDPYATRPAKEGHGEQAKPSLPDLPQELETTPQAEPEELPPLKTALVWIQARKKRLALIGGGAVALIVVVAVASWILSVGKPPDIPYESISVALDETYQVALQPEGKEVLWSSEDEAIASVDENGLITAHGKGATVITARDALGHQDTCTVNVVNRMITLTVTPSQCKMNVGDEFQLSVEVFPQDALTDSLLWRSNRPEIVSVTQDGLLTAHDSGEATITVSSGNVRGECRVTVWPAVTGVTLSAPKMQDQGGVSTLEIAQGKSETLKAVLSPQEANERDDILWSSSDETVALVEPSGKVTGRQPGKATITASCDGQSAECEVTVSVPVESVTVKPSKLEGLKPGESQKLVATIAPENATNQTVEWSSFNPSVAKVDASGAVTAISKGTATIQALCDGKSGSCTVNVVDPTNPGTSAATQTTRPSNSSTSSSAAATTNPPSSATSSSAATTSNPSATTSSKTSGSETSSSHKNSESSVVKPTEIKLDVSELSMKPHDERTITATVSPESASMVQWSSNNESVATVSQSGKITAVAPGNAIITASCGDVPAHCAVSVNPVEVVSVDILDETGTPALDAIVIVGETMSLKAVINPSNATDQTVQWTSSNPSAALVDNNGLVTAVGEGSATITATCGGKPDSVQITAVYLFVDTDDGPQQPPSTPIEIQPADEPIEIQPAEEPVDIQPSSNPIEIPWEDDPTEEPVPEDPGEIWIH